MVLGLPPMNLSFSLNFMRVTEIQNNNTKGNEIKKGGGPRGQHGRPARITAIQSNKGNELYKGGGGPRGQQGSPARPSGKFNHDKPTLHKSKPDKPKPHSSVVKHSTSNKYKPKSTRNHPNFSLQ